MATNINVFQVILFHISTGVKTTGSGRLKEEKVSFQALPTSILYTGLCLHRSQDDWEFSMATPSGGGGGVCSQGMATSVSSSQPTVPCSKRCQDSDGEDVGEDVGAAKTLRKARSDCELANSNQGGGLPIQYNYCFFPQRYCPHSTDICGNTVGSMNYNTGNCPS